MRIAPWYQFSPKIFCRADLNGDDDWGCLILVTFCRGRFPPVLATKLPHLHICNQLHFPVHPNDITKGAFQPRAHRGSYVRGLSCSHSLAALAKPPSLRPQRGERVEVAIQTPARPAADSPGGIAAAYGAHRPPHERRRPGPVPAPDTDNLTLVNRDRQMVERKKEGDFVARPVFSRRTEVLYYSIRHPDTGEWITNTYRVRGGEKQLSEGWEYTFEYPALDEQSELRHTCWCWPCPAWAAATTTRWGAPKRHCGHNTDSRGRRLPSQSDCHWRIDNERSVDRICELDDLFLR